MANETSWKPEGFDRPKLTVEEVGKLLDELRERMPAHFAAYDPGIFLHPHEIVGCMCGQHAKLSASADESIYSGDLSQFRERCVKTLLAILVSTASVDRLAILRKGC